MTDGSRGSGNSNSDRHFTAARTVSTLQKGRKESFVRYLLLYCSYMAADFMINRRENSFYAITIYTNPSYAIKNYKFPSIPSNIIFNPFHVIIRHRLHSSVIHYSVS